MTLSDAQVNALKQLKAGSAAVIDRYGRIVIAGEISPQSAETFLRLVSMGLVEGFERHLYPTIAGIEAIEDVKP